MINFIQWLISLFKKPSSGVLPTVSGGSDQVYVPPITMDGNWLPYMTKPYETQYTGFDQLNCTTKSGMHMVEAILNYFYKNKLFSVPEMYTLLEKGGYLNSNGDIDLSERFTAKMAGTTRNGLAQDKFWQSINRDGFVPKKVWPETGITDWTTYYKKIPADVKAAGARSAKIFQWAWKVIENGNWNAPNLPKIREALTHSPIHFSTCLCNRDYAGVMRYCGSKIYQHAMTLYSVGDYQNILDQYDPFLRKSESSYPMACCIVASLYIP